jgi:hypothetical protein
MISSPNGPLDGIRGKEEIMTSSQISPQVIVPDIGFAASIGPQGGSRASENRARDRETDDRSSPKLIEYLAVGFVAIAVAFGPPIAALL